MKRAVVISPNWIGDVIMAMPAVAGFRARSPETEIVVAARPKVTELWSLLSDSLRVVSLEGSSADQVATLRSIAAEWAFILPHSFRSAFLPWAARVDERRGVAGHWRRIFLTEVVSLDTRVPTAPHHQSREYG